MARLVLPAWSLGDLGVLPERTFQVDPGQLHGLVKAARHASATAYAYFSKFRVGAALVMADDVKGTVIAGANVENSSYGLTNCAERVAIQTAVAHGWRRLRYLAVSCGTAPGAALADRSPCGACRQVIREFADAETLILVDRGTPDFDADVFDIERLLPFGFRFAK